jgi:hypothetical protein
LSEESILLPPGYCEYAAGPCDQDFSQLGPTAATFLYPSRQTQVAATIEAAVRILQQRSPDAVWRTWRDLETTGQIIFCGICKRMRFSQCIVSDVTTLNFNLLFEIGYALGLERPVVPIRDTTIITSKADFQELGLLDTIGYLDFQNAEALAASLLDRLPVEPIPNPRVELNREKPLFVVKPPIQTEGDVRLMSTLKKSYLYFRTYDVIETPRLSLHEVRRRVNSSLAVIAHLLSPTRHGAVIHNARCALFAGLAMATQKAVYLLQEDRVEQPIDYRDIIVSYDSPDQVPRLVEPFIREVIELLQVSTLGVPRPPEGFLESLDLGDLAAENEVRGLRSYFVRTAQYNEARRGRARLVTGRKGAGKTALFYGIRDSIPRGHGHLVLDLKPEGHQFTKLREAVLSRLSPGLQEHTLTAFWNYILLCEIAQKVRDKDYAWAQRDVERWERFSKLLEVYSTQVPAEVGDFSERLLRQVDNISARFPAEMAPEGLIGSELTQALFLGDIRTLDDALALYLVEKNDVWVLIDNLDKGWPTRGTRSSEILILRTLLEATRKLQRQFEQRDVGFHVLVFLRNDIYEHLLLETSDRGKDTAISLDWNDIEVFREIIAERIRATSELSGSFDGLWAHISERFVGTQDSFRYMVDRTLMRPRDLLGFVHEAIGVAINRRHEQVTEDDIRKAEEVYSEDLLLSTAFELRDIHDDMLDLLYAFNLAPARMTSQQVSGILDRHGVGEGQRALLESLVWFGFLGVQEHGQDDPVYSYQVRYNVQKLLAPIERGRAVFVIHPGFRKALQVQDVE